MKCQPTTPAESDATPESLRELCLLHPLGGATLARNAGIAKSVLSNFFAGRRPIPSHARPQLFDQLGLTAAGRLKEEHCFVFEVAQSSAEIAHKWLRRIFPEGGHSIRLSDEYVQAGKAIAPSGQALIRWGWALRSGRTFALIREMQDLEHTFKLTGPWDLLYLNTASGALLQERATDPDAVRRLFSQQAMDFPVTWADVQDYCKSVGITAESALSSLRGLPGAAS